MKFLRFRDYLTEAQLNEIGEGVTPFPYRRKSPTKVEGWIAELAGLDRSNVPVSSNWIPLHKIEYTFESEKAKYRVSIPGWYNKHTWIPVFTKPGAKPQEYNMLIGMAFDVEGGDKEAITNFGEQFRVVSTAVEILNEVAQELMSVKWLKLQEIHIVPKTEDEETGKPITQTKRGRMYLAYIQKQGKRLKGDWTAEITTDRFIMKNGKITSSTHPDRYIQI